MKVRIDLSLDDYVRNGNANTDGLLAGHHPLRRHSETSRAWSIGTAAQCPAQRDVFGMLRWRNFGFRP